MASIKISQLNQMTTMTSDDFIPVVDSGSLTTFHTPITVFDNWMSTSGSAKSASWASRSVHSDTASYSETYKEHYTFVKNLSSTLNDATSIATYFNVLHPYQLLVGLSVWGNYCSCGKTYMIMVPYDGPSKPFGWRTAMPLVATEPYQSGSTKYSDFDLEISKSNEVLAFRVRSWISPAGAAARPTASLTILNLLGWTGSIVSPVDGIETSSNTIPIYRHSFVQQSSYILNVSGSICSQGITSSMLFGTSSWAISASNAITSSYVKSASYSLNATSASHANSASFTYGTASYAMAIPSSGPVTIGGIVPIGTMLDFCGTSCPDSNWLMCTGSVLNISDYAELASIIGNTWGGNGVTTFGLPDMRKRMAIGYRSSKNNDSFLSNSVGNVGGGEAYNYHYHLAGVSNQYHSNNDFFFPVIGETTLSSSNLAPRFWADPANKQPGWMLPGDTTLFSITFFGGDNVTVNGTQIDQPWIGTSFGISDNKNWYSGDSTWTTPIDSTATVDPVQTFLGRRDLSMPYAVTMKIIRAR